MNHLPEKGFIAVKTSVKVGYKKTAGHSGKFNRLKNFTIVRLMLQKYCAKGSKTLSLAGLFDTVRLSVTAFMIPKSLNQSALM
jgi:hypothetical protein